MSGHDDLVKEFLLESAENLEQLERDLVALENDGHDRGRLDGVFRTLHTIKGTSGFFDFTNLAALSHAGESLLSRLRSGEQSLTGEIVSCLLSLVDALRQILAAVERTGREGPDDHAALIARLNHLQGGAPAPDAPPPAPANAPESSAVDFSESGIRVDVALLDRLLNLVGELVLTRNQIAQLAPGRECEALARASQRLNLITTELQAGVMKTRMRAVGCLWEKLPRLVRDLSLASGKQVRLDLDGAATELDRSVLEAVKDPLTHLVRNAIAHGIETPADRRARGKPAAGRVRLCAFHESGQVTIEVADDGAGMDPRAIRRKALERGLITPEAAGRLGEREQLQLVFLPGLSTAEAVTSLSGRGVGMDVVKTCVERVGGTVDLESRPGAGTVVRLRIPLTLAIVPALVVGCDGERYAVPQVSLLELVRPGREQIERVHGVPVYRLRGSLLPLVSLRDVLRAAPAPPDGPVNIVVLRAGERRFGLVVDRVIDTQEIVVKPPSRQLTGLGLYAGTTILGDGAVALILDVPALARAARVASEGQSRTAEQEPAGPRPAPAAREQFILCELGRLRRLAIPFARVRRLENVPPSAVEMTAGGAVTQYRGRILPLVHLARVLGEADASPAAGGDASLRLAVCSDGTRDVGLVVDRILDTIEADVELQHAGRRPGIAGSAVIGRKVTDLLDVDAVLAAADGRLTGEGANRV